MEALNITRMASARIPIRNTEFNLILYVTNQDNKEHLALVLGDPALNQPALVRVHSECFTGDVLGSRRCDCGEQLDAAIDMVAHQRHGIILYLRQEGRGIGLLDKLKAYNLQDEGFDTVDANLMLGHAPDERDYTVAARILEDLGVKRIHLLTNNPDKIDSLEALGINVARRVPLQAESHPDNRFYLLTKAHRMAHMLDLSELQRISQHNKNDSPNGKHTHDG